MVDVVYVLVAFHEQIPKADCSSIVHACVKLPWYMSSLVQHTNEHCFMVQPAWRDDVSLHVSTLGTRQIDLSAFHVTQVADVADSGTFRKTINQNVAGIIDDINQDVFEAENRRAENEVSIFWSSLFCFCQLSHNIDTCHSTMLIIITRTTSRLCVKACLCACMRS